jgi:hypothetical protein
VAVEQILEYAKLVAIEIIVPFKIELIIPKMYANEISKV